MISGRVPRGARDGVLGDAAAATHAADARLAPAVGVLLDPAAVHHLLRGGAAHGAGGHHQETRRGRRCLAGEFSAFRQPSLTHPTALTLSRGVARI